MSAYALSGFGLPPVPNSHNNNSSTTHQPTSTSVTGTASLLSNYYSNCTRMTTPTTTSSHSRPIDYPGIPKGRRSSSTTSTSGSEYSLLPHPSQIEVPPLLPPPAPLTSPSTSTSSAGELKIVVKKAKVDPAKLLKVATSSKKLTTGRKRSTSSSWSYSSSSTSSTHSPNGRRNRSSMRRSRCSPMSTSCGTTLDDAINLELSISFNGRTDYKAVRTLAQFNQLRDGLLEEQRYRRCHYHHHYFTSDGTTATTPVDHHHPHHDDSSSTTPHEEEEESSLMSCSRTIPELPCVLELAGLSDTASGGGHHSLLSPSCRGGQGLFTMFHTAMLALPYRVEQWLYDALYSVPASDSDSPPCWSNFLWEPLDPDEIDMSTHSHPPDGETGLPSTDERRNEEDDPNSSSSSPIVKPKYVRTSSNGWRQSWKPSRLRTLTDNDDEDVDNGDEDNDDDHDDEGNSTTVSPFYSSTTSSLYFEEEEGDDESTETGCDDRTVCRDIE